MLDLSRFTDAISSLLSNAAALQVSEVPAIPELLSGLGIDLALLDGLNQGEILQLLEQHGIDPSQLAGEQLAELMQYAGGAQPLVDIAQAWHEHPER